MKRIRSIMEAAAASDFYGEKSGKQSDVPKAAQASLAAFFGGSGQKTAQKLQPLKMEGSKII